MALSLLPLWDGAPRSWLCLNWTYCSSQGNKSYLSASFRSWHEVGTEPVSHASQESPRELGFFLAEDALELMLQVFSPSSGQVYF